MYAHEMAGSEHLRLQEYALRGPRLGQSSEKTSILGPGERALQPGREDPVQICTWGSSHLAPLLLFPAPPCLWRPAPTQPNCPPELLITEPPRPRDLFSHHFSRATLEVAMPLGTTAR